jgi:hypothetical protein
MAVDTSHSVSARTDVVSKHSQPSSYYKQIQIEKTWVANCTWNCVLTLTSKLAGREAGARGTHSWWPRVLDWQQSPYGARHRGWWCGGGEWGHRYLACGRRAPESKGNKFWIREEKWSRAQRQGEMLRLCYPCLFFAITCLSAPRKNMLSSHPRKIPAIRYNYKESVSCYYTIFLLPAFPWLDIWVFPYYGPFCFQGNNWLLFAKNQFIYS